MSKASAVILLLLSITLSLLGQEPDTGLIVQDSGTVFQFGEEISVTDTVDLPMATVERLEKDPIRAIMLAMVLPGLGQAYNERYWKIPIVYGAIGAAGYAIAFNTGNYRESVELYKEDGSTINEQRLRYWRRNMELSYIAAVAVYGLQILDAYVDALLFTWDVNDQLSIRVAPSLKPMLVPGQAPVTTAGLSLSLRLGK